MASGRDARYKNVIGELRFLKRILIWHYFFFPAQKNFQFFFISFYLY